MNRILTFTWSAIAALTALVLGVAFTYLVMRMSYAEHALSEVRAELSALKGEHVDMADAQILGTVQTIHDPTLIPIDAAKDEEEKTKK